MFLSDVSAFDGHAPGIFKMGFGGQPGFRHQVEIKLLSPEVGYWVSFIHFPLGESGRIISPELEIPPPRFTDLTFSGRLATQNNRGGVISPTPASLRRASRSSHFEIWASQKPTFSTSFIRFVDMAESHTVYSVQSNAFRMLLGPKCKKRLQKYP